MYKYDVDVQYSTNNEDEDDINIIYSNVIYVIKMYSSN